MKQVLLNRQNDVTVVCENIHDPHNVSAIFRSCDAVGVSQVHLLYTTESFPEIGKKTSASAKKWIEINRHKNYQDLRTALKNQQMAIYATGVSPQAYLYYEIDWTKPSAIILGNEHRGVSDEAVQIADHQIKIPMFGMVESLNVSVASAVILYEVCRQRLRTGKYPSKSEQGEWFKTQLAQWLKRG